MVPLFWDYSIWTIPALISFWILLSITGFCICFCAALVFSTRSDITCSEKRKVLHCQWGIQIRILKHSQFYHNNRSQSTSWNHEVCFFTCLITGSVRMFWISGSSIPFSYKTQVKKGDPKFTTWFSLHIYMRIIRVLTSLSFNFSGVRPPRLALLVSFTQLQNILEPH